MTAPVQDGAGAGDSSQRLTSPWRPMGLGAAVGLVVALVSIDPGFITGSGALWAHPQNDVVMYLVPWNYFLADEWRLPLFHIPAMGYPEGGSILFNDALPIGTLLVKLVYSATGVRINPFGWWILLTYVLQGAMAARLVVAAGARSAWAAVAAAVFAVCCWAFLFRLHLGHIAVSSHFVLLWALALHFECTRLGRAKTLGLFALSATTLLVNPYLFVMVMLIVLATGMTLLTRRQLTTRDFGHAALSLVGLLAIAGIAGYGHVVANPSQMQAPGNRLFSWNLLALLVPPDGFFGLVPPIVRDATTGQFEGEAYIGDGALLVVLLALLGSPRRVLHAVRRHAWLCGALALTTWYAASDRVYLGPDLVLAYDLPGVLAEGFAYFRASGRFIWPLAYALPVLALALVFRDWPRRVAIGVVLVTVPLQVSDARAFLEQGRAATSVTYPDLLGARVHGWIQAHERLWVYPSWGCGGLAGPEQPFGNPAENRELQLQLAASRAGVPTNSVSTSRVLKDCQAEAEWARQPELEDGVLYLVAHRSVRDSAPLARRARSGGCVRLPWAFACSTTMDLREDREVR